MTIRTAAAVLFVIFSVPVRGQVPPPVLEKAQEEKEVFLNELWRGLGRVVVGRVELQDPTDKTLIVSRTEILDEGYFAAALYPSRQLCFRAHGYEPLNVSFPSGFEPIVFVDDLVLVPTEPSERSQWHGRITGLDRQEKAEVVLRVAPAPLLWEDWAYECAANYTAFVAKKELSSGQTFTFSGLSPISYEVEITAPGYNAVSETRLVTRGATELMGDVELVRSARFDFEYVSQFSDVDELRALSRQTATITCDGKGRFLFTDERDELGNRLDLRINPNDEGPEIAFWFFPSSIYDLGEQSLDTAIDGFAFEEVRLSEKKRSQVMLQSGHVYFFECPEKSATCLFAVRSAAEL